jgi:hypothetical protein
VGRRRIQHYRARARYDPRHRRLLAIPPRGARHAGVSSYGFAELVRDYDRALLFVLHRLVCGLDAVDLGDRRGRALLAVMLRRTAARVRRVPAPRLLEPLP